MPGGSLSGLLRAPELFEGTWYCTCQQPVKCCCISRRSLLAPGSSRRRSVASFAPRGSGRRERQYRKDERLAIEEAWPCVGFAASEGAGLARRLPAWIARTNVRAPNGHHALAGKLRKA